MRLDVQEKQQEKEKKKIDWKAEIISWLWTIGIALAIVFVVNTFIARVVNVDGASMLPTLTHGERIITTPLHGELQRGDIVVIHRENDTAIIKRIVAVAGDTVDIDYDTGTLYVNGEAVEEDYISAPMHFVAYQGGNTKLPLTVEEGYVFVLGDNRNVSLDSRAAELGAVEEKAVFGKAIFRIWPFDKFGLIE